MLVIRGEAGVGKTALMRYAADQAVGFRVARSPASSPRWSCRSPACISCARRCSTGSTRSRRRSRTRCASRSASRPAPRPTASSSAWRRSRLLAEVAEEQPLLCLVDDLQWLDDASAQVLGFVARRLLAEPIAIVFARPRAERRAPARRPAGAAAAKGSTTRTRARCSATVVPGRLDEHVRERIIAETRGNPLALLELPRGMSAAELAGGFGRPVAAGGLGTAEDGFRRRLDALPADTRRLLQLAAADPVGEPLLVWRAAEQLGIDPQAATPAVDAGLLEIGAQVRFRHPCVRSAAYRSAPPEERHALHAALAEATDPELDPDRRAWHRAQATAGPDEEVAEELERSAGRALARGGVAAAAAFLESAATLTPDPARRARRLLAAARAKRDAGALDARAGAARRRRGGPGRRAAGGGDRAAARRDRLRPAPRRRGRAAAHQRGAALRAARRRAARTTHLKALGAAMWAGPRRAARGGRGRPGRAARARRRRARWTSAARRVRDPA